MDIPQLDPIGLGIAFRASRLAAGTASTEDIATIFLHLRRRSFGNKLVSEIGDFVAHSDERDRGVALSFAQDLSDAVSFKLRVLQSKSGKKPGANGIDTLRRGLIAGFKLMGPLYAQKTLGVNAETALHRLERAIKKVVRFVDGKVEMSPRCSVKDLRTLQAYFAVLPAYPRFSAAELMAELYDSLLENGLIESKDVGLLALQHERLGLFCLSKMHLAKILLDGFPPALLSVGVEYGDRGDDLLGIQILIPATELGDGTTVALPFFDTNCHVSDWCSGRVRALLDAPGKSLAAPVEINSDGQLDTFY